MKGRRQRKPPAPRSLQEWMQVTGFTAERLRVLVKTKTGREISRTMMSFILTGSRRCSLANAADLHAVTKVPIDVLIEWPKVSGIRKSLGARPQMEPECLR